MEILVPRQRLYEESSLEEAEDVAEDTPQSTFPWDSQPVPKPMLLLDDVGKFKKLGMEDSALNKMNN